MWAVTLTENYRVQNSWSSVHWEYSTATAGRKQYWQKQWKQTYQKEEQMTYHNNESPESGAGIASWEIQQSSVYYVSSLLCA